MADSTTNVLAEWERNEQALRDQLGDVSILPTLRQFRERMEAGAQACGESRACRCMG